MIFQYNEHVGNCLLFGKEINSMGVCQGISIFPVILLGVLFIVIFLYLAKITRESHTKDASSIKNEEDKKDE